MLLSRAAATAGVSRAAATAGVSRADTDKSGKLEGRELKPLLMMVGFPMAILLPIPDAVQLDYRSILDGLAKATAKQ